jgi:very-short-patch-repair endonuclease
LRRKHLSKAKFRRQEPVGKFIVDFVSFENKLIIEIDGSPHREKEVKFSDTQRTEWLQSEGYKVLRFWNSEINDNIEKVIEKINQYLK